MICVNSEVFIADPLSYAKLDRKARQGMSIEELLLHLWVAQAMHGQQPEVL